MISMIPPLCCCSRSNATRSSCSFTARRPARVARQRMYRATFGLVHATTLRIEAMQRLVDSCRRHAEHPRDLRRDLRFMLGMRPERALDEVAQRDGVVAQRGVCRCRAATASRWHGGRLKHVCDMLTFVRLQRQTFEHFERQHLRVDIGRQTERLQLRPFELGETLRTALRPARHQRVRFGFSVTTLSGLPGDETLDVRRPALQRVTLLGIVAVALIDACDATERTADVVQQFFDRWQLHAERSETAGSCAAQIVEVATPQPAAA